MRSATTVHSPATPPSSPRPALLIGAMLTVACVLALTAVDAGRVAVASPRIPLLVLVVSWVAFELVVLYLQFGKDLDNGEQVTITEVVTALALLFATPVDLVVLVVVTPALVDFARGPKSVVKRAFNLVNRTVEALVALAVFQALVPAEPLSVEGWGALCVAVVVAALVARVHVTMLLSLMIGRLPRHDLVRDVVSAAAVAFAAATVAFIVALALQAGAVAVAPLVTALVTFLLLMRGFSLLTDRRLDLESLHALGAGLAGTRDPDTILVSTLESVAQLLVAREVVAYLSRPEDPTHLVRVRVGADGALERSTVALDAAPAHRGLDRESGTVVTQARLAPGHRVVLAVSGRSTSMRRFTRADARLLDMVTHHAAPNLATAQLIEQLRRDAVRDPVTGALNRDGVLQVARAQVREHRAVVLVWLDVDIEVVTAALGHAQGDELLVQVARRLETVGTDVSVGRVGGHEFALVVPGGVEGRESPVAAASVLGCLDAPFLLSGVQVTPRATLGVAESTLVKEVSAEDLLRHADVALRSAQRLGLLVEHYAPQLTATSADRLALAVELQRGIAHDELTLHAQPQVRLGDGALVGVEMLVRWNHPRRGLMFPGEFVPLAEQTGLDRPLTAWVLEASLEALAAWRAAGLHLTVSVNVSTGALCDAALPASTQELLERHGVPGHSLVIEMTESALLTNTTLAAEVLQGLSALGVKVSIDDFGTGFSSLSHLRRLPVDEVKIDQSFVRTMLEDDDDAAIVRSVINLGKDLNLAVVAEGIESDQVYDALRVLGCDTAQGYHVAVPMPIVDVCRWAALQCSAARTSGRPPLVTTLMRPGAAG